MAVVVERAAYAGQLAALLPQGRAWPTDGDSTLARLLDAEAVQLADIDLLATALLDEALPSRTSDLLPEWERDLGLPDDCSAEAGTLAQRRAAVFNKEVARHTLNPEDFRALGRSYGVEIRIREHDQAAADAIPGLDTSGGKWRFVWWITIPTEADTVYFDTLSDVNTPARRDRAQ